MGMNADWKLKTELEDQALKDYFDNGVPEDLKPQMRYFTSGATRDSDLGKLDFEGFDSPLVNKRYAQYMHTHRLQVDGTMRGSDNWQMGIDKEAYVKSLIRHVEDIKLHWDGFPDEAVDQDIESVLCAVLFNVKGMLYELLKEKRLACRTAHVTDNAQ